MRNVLALILSLVSFFFLFESLNAVAVLLDNSFNLWGIVQLLIIDSLKRIIDFQWIM